MTSENTDRNITTPAKVVLPPESEHTEQHASAPDNQENPEFSEFGTEKSKKKFFGKKQKATAVVLSGVVGLTLIPAYLTTHRTIQPRPHTQNQTKETSPTAPSAKHPASPPPTKITTPPSASKKPTAATAPTTPQPQPKTEDTQKKQPTPPPSPSETTQPSQASVSLKAPDAGPSPVSVPAIPPVVPTTPQIEPNLPSQPEAPHINANLPDSTEQPFNHSLANDPFSPKLVDGNYLYQAVPDDISLYRIPTGETPDNPTTYSRTQFHSMILDCETRDQIKSCFVQQSSTHNSVTLNLRIGTAARVSPAPHPLHNNTEAPIANGNSWRWIIMLQMPPNTPAGAKIMLDTDIGSGFSPPLDPAKACDTQSCYVSFYINEDPKKLIADETHPIVATIRLSDLAYVWRFNSDGLGLAMQRMEREMTNPSLRATLLDTVPQKTKLPTK